MGMAKIGFRVNPELNVSNQEVSNGTVLSVTHQPTPEKKEDGPECNEIVSPVDEMKIKSYIIKRDLTRETAVAAVTSSTVLQPNFYGSVPLFIEDILKIQVTEDSFTSAHILFGIEFKIVVFYGRLKFLKFKETGERKLGYYSVDDGTGTISVHFNHNKTSLLSMNSRLAEIEREIRLQRNNCYWKYKHCIDNMLIVFNKTRTHLQSQKYHHGETRKALVFGAPFLFLNEKRVFAFEMFTHGDNDCDYEIYFKNLLFNVYTSNFFNHKLNS